MAHIGNFFRAGSVPETAKMPNSIDTRHLLLRIPTGSHLLHWGERESLSTSRLFAFFMAREFPPFSAENLKAFIWLTQEKKNFEMRYSPSPVPNIFLRVARSS